MSHLDSCILDYNECLLAADNDCDPYRETCVNLNYTLSSEKQTEGMYPSLISNLFVNFYHDRGLCVSKLEIWSKRQYNVRVLCLARCRFATAQQIHV